VSRPMLGPTQSSMEWLPGVLSPGIKHPRCETEHSPPTSAEVKSAWSYNSIPPYIFMAWDLTTGTTLPFITNNASPRVLKY